MSDLAADLLTSRHSIRRDPVRAAGSRVVVLCEPGRSGSAALDLARRLVRDYGSELTVVSVAPQDRRICCGAGSAMDFNRAVCEACEVELRDACELLGREGSRALFKVLVQDKDPPFAAWIAAGDFDVVLLPAHRRPLSKAKHPAAGQLRRLTSAEVYVVDARSGIDEPLEEILASHRAGSDP